MAIICEILNPEGRSLQVVLLIQSIKKFACFTDVEFAFAVASRSDKGVL